ncbi:retrovirus-related pol polyprotein from transposon TNT 1-94 [Tanacetum coccineum]|uniref:Retrovirus-related pol polyprotein from transposon TNT 1-94 n=1 Tax=Tanacetum coccineum TaxID=301880 RepID=A0ABQ4XVH7_9ASTR
MCVVNILNSVNATSTVKIVLNKGKQIWKPKGRLSDNSLYKTKRVWKATGKLFTDIGYQWRPTRKKLALGKLDCGYQWRPTGNKFPLGEMCHLTKLSVKCCSKHMTGNRSKLMNFVEKFIGSVRFGNDHLGAIMGYGDYVMGDSVISRVYYVEGLGHNLFSVGQFCDSDLEVAFRKHTCFVRDIKGTDILKGSRGTNLYTISIDEMMKSSPICLLSKASKSKSWLWHRRLNHLNFGTINDLARKDLVRGLPRLKFEKDHLCSACQLGKSKKFSHRPKSENTNMEVLHTLHMDLCGPMRVQSIKGKKYILVIVDDYSRFTWVKFLRSKDETPEFVTNFLKQIQVGLNKTVRFIRTDNGTEFVNQVMSEYYEGVGIFHQKSVPRTPQQNGVVERRNRTLVEAARTMMIFSKAPMFLWAEAVATACYTQNRSLIHTRHNKTPYELVHDKKPDLTFFRVFGALCYPTNDSEVDKHGIEDRYALTHNPTIYDSLVKQFWQTATVRTLANGTQQLVASIDSKEYTITEASVRRDFVPLLPAMLAGAAMDQGDGSAQPAEPHHTPVDPLPSTSLPPIPSPPLQSPPHSPLQSPPHSPHSPLQSPPHLPLQSPPRSYKAPLPKGNTSGSAEASIQLKELMVLVPNLVTKVTSLEKELKETKQTLGNAVLKLVKKVKSLEIALKRKSKKVIVSASEGEEPEDQGRIIQDIDDDPLVSLVRESMKEKSTDFVTPTKASGEAQEEEISPTILEAAKTLSKVASQSVSKAKSTDKGKRYRRRARSMAKNINTGLDAEDEINTGRVEINTGIEDVNTEEDWDTIRAKLEGNAELTKSLEGESMTSKDFAKRMVEMINQKKKFYAEQKAKARRSKPMTQAHQRDYMSTVIKNQSSWRLTQLKKLTFDELKTEFEKLVKSIENFMPMETDERYVKKRGKIRKQKARKGIHIDKTAQDESEEEREAFMKDKVTSASSESEIGNDAIPTATKPPTILKDFSRDDLTELYRLVIKKYGANRQEEMYDRCCTKALATPEQTATGKEISNPLTADSLLKTIREDKMLLKIKSQMLNQCFIIVALDLSKVANPLQAKGSRSIHKMAEQDTPPPTITAMKIPIIKKGEYDIWSMRMRQYICHTDHNLWDIIVNGDLQEEPAPTGDQSGPSAPPVPKTAKQLAAKRNQERVKSILLLAIPDEYLLKFHNVPDAKSL